VGVRECEDTNRTTEAGNRDEVEGAVANTLNLFPNGAVGFIDWLDYWRAMLTGVERERGELRVESERIHQTRQIRQ
jgi:hypothetical protein